MAMKLSEKSQVLGGKITDVLAQNDGFDAEGLAAVLTVMFAMFKVFTVPDENGKKKERIREMINDMLDKYFEEDEPTQA